MTRRIATISNIRQVKDLHQSLEELLPTVKETVTAGCGVSPFLKGYAERVLKNDPTDNPILAQAGFTWEKGGRTRIGIGAFSIVSRNPDYYGIYLSVRRVMKEDVTWCKHQSLGHTREFHAHAAERMKHRTPMCSTTLLVLGDTIKTLISMGKFLISFKVDNGIHLVFKEAVRSNRYLEIYVGGWFDETRFPLADLHHTKQVNPLRQPNIPCKEINYGPNLLARDRSLPTVYR